MEMMKSFTNIPQDITRDFLSRLTAETAVRCKLVCKTWRTIIDDPTFVSDQWNNPKSTMDVETLSFYVQAPDLGKGLRAEYNGGSFRITILNIDTRSPREQWLASRSPWHVKYKMDVLVGSANGLMCILAGQRLEPCNMSSGQFCILAGQGLEPCHMFQVFNPFTREHAFLPPFHDQEAVVWSTSTITCIKGYGFGYHHSTKEYKVVCITYPKAYSTIGLLQVYTLGSRRRWRSRGTVTHSLCTSQGTAWDGAIYWMTKNKEMVSLNLEDEKVQLYVLPRPDIANKLDEKVQLYVLPLLDTANKLMVLGGCLCSSFLTVHQGEKIAIDTNIMELNNDVWTKKVGMPFMFDAALSILQDGTYLLFKSGRLVIYDPQTASSTSIYYMPFWNYTSFIPYVTSFVSLKALGEENVVNSR